MYISICKCLVGEAELPLPIPKMPVLKILDFDTFWKDRGIVFLEIWGKTYSWVSVTHVKKTVTIGLVSTAVLSLCCYMLRSERQMIII